MVFTFLKIIFNVRQRVKMFMYQRMHSNMFIAIEFLKMALVFDETDRTVI